MEDELLTSRKETSKEEFGWRFAQFSSKLEISAASFAFGKFSRLIGSLSEGQRSTCKMSGKNEKHPSP